MEYTYHEGQTKQPVLVLLHGTGGDETSMLPIARALAPEASYLSFRGDVNEYGALRFFKRKAEGVYDIDDLFARGQALAERISHLSQKHGFDLADVVLVGFSNGANIAIHLLLEHSKYLKKGILMAPLYPLDVEDKDLSESSVFISTGEADPIASPEDGKYVVSLFEKAGASVEHHWVFGHQITSDIVEKARQWLNKL
ncbi:alpha/beta hydrolase [Streptococcus fryi]